MNEELQLILDDAKEQMQKAIEHLENELAKIRAGRANPMMLENIMVDYYGNRTHLRHTANINSQDARTLIIQPWEAAMLEPIERAIQAANLGITPQNVGKIIRLSIPPLTEERRKEMVKKVKGEAENCKVSRKYSLGSCPTEFVIPRHEAKAARRPPIEVYSPTRGSASIIAAMSSRCTRMNLPTNRALSRPSPIHS